MSSAKRTSCIPFARVLIFAAFASLPGCNNSVQPPDDGGNNGGGGTGQPVRAALMSPASNFGVSLLDPPISVVYSMPEAATEITGFFIQLEGPSPDRPAIADAVTIAENLPTGASQSFTFNPSEAGLGFFRLGVSYALDGVPGEVLSTGVIHVQGSPSPSFIQPDQDLVVVEKGEDLTILFDLGDPDGQVQWRLFRLTAGQSRTAPAHQLGTQLATGSGNDGSFEFKTESMPLGDHTLGVSATDSGSSVAATATRGELAKIVTIPNDDVSTPTIRVVEPGTTTPPTIQVTAPASQVVLFRDDPFTIQFAAQVNLAGADGRVRLFYDTDRNPNNGTTTIRNNLADNMAGFAFPPNLPEGIYNIGATITDDVNLPVTAYAPGSIKVVHTVTLDVTQPSSPLPVTPGTMVNVAWITNAPPSAGDIDVFARAIDSNEQPTGPEIPILTNEPLSTRSAKFTRNQPGRFQVSARINVRDNTTTADSAPQFVRFSSLPGVLWVQTLADRTAGAGAVFGGVQPEDNAGSALSTAGDLNGDGFDEFAVVSRFGKPRFNNPNGIGQGEAYVLYGGSGAQRLLGESSLNSVGDTLPGVTLTGIPARTESGSAKTDGISKMTLIPDADGDSKGELVFSFTYVDSPASGTFAPTGQFDEGGMVTVSSRNHAFQLPLNDNVIELSGVGRSFFIPPDLPFTIGGPTFEDRFSCAADPTAPANCICDSGTDDEPDTISIGFGFGGRLGTIPNLLCFSADFEPDFGFSDTPPPPLSGRPEYYSCLSWPFDGDCGFGNPWQWANLTCGEGSYGAGMINTTPLGFPVEPFGARIIGPRTTNPTGSHFSISVGVSEVEPGVEDILVAAPHDSGGVVFMFDNREIWDGTAPRPYQYIAGGGGVCPGTPTQGIMSGRANGVTGDALTEVLGIEDFNGDGRNDFVTSSPQTGKVYVAFRREEQLEGTYQLSKLALPLDNSERLDGLMITGNPGFGSRLAAIDLNHDGFDDLVISNPGIDGNTGEVYVIFSHTGLVTPGGGSPIESLLDETRCGPRVAMKITGNSSNKGQFGFNVVNAGDLDGDGRAELVVASPDSTPRFDPDPSDDVDELTEDGIDLDEDGNPDNPWPVTNAGVVYVLNGSTLFDRTWSCSSGQVICNPDLECDTDEECINPNPESCSQFECTLKGEFCRVSNDCPNGHRCNFGRCTSTVPKLCNPNAECPGSTCRPQLDITQLGSKSFPGFLIAGRRADDHLGGGYSGKTFSVGLDASFGLAAGGDIDGDGRADLLIGSMLADPRPDPASTRVIPNGGETYLLYGSAVPDPQ